MRRLCTFLLIFCLPAAATGQAIGFYLDFAPRLAVNPVSSTSFEVIESGGAGAQDMWCAAASYAQNRLGIRRGRMYVARAIGPAETVRGRKGVVFTTQPTADAFTSVSVSVKEPGMNLPIFHALQFCTNNIRERED